MTDTPAPLTQPEPDYIAAAGDLLEGMLTSGADLETELALSAALVVLYDVWPPYPPRIDPAAPIDTATGLPLLLAVLTSAESSGANVEEVLRTGRASRELHPLRDRQ